LRFDGQGATTKPKLVVQKIDGGAPVQEIAAPPAVNNLGWSPDGHALTYSRTTVGNIINVYMQSLAGGAEGQLTHFECEPAVVTAFAWSRDGKKFAVTRSRYADTDVVMFSGFR